jgi:hypothetical protein
MVFPPILVFGCRLNARNITLRPVWGRSDSQRRHMQNNPGASKPERSQRVTAKKAYTGIIQQSF